ncbi:hypothetical protein I7I53_02747 [Histoplasma capsulatum var. duboisii H88]|uniref:Uncharacterized protein n=1 Tax=Ajellomyces capsulatus (strain H88) TaxID=544711 RepID=A0A8A1LKY1_AJEC8|nr:hypothetical protein I7I53_02747 [Histoplasma capsulatum var. duboisii H88]
MPLIQVLKRLFILLQLPNTVHNSLHLSLIKQPPNMQQIIPPWLHNEKLISDILHHAPFRLPPFRWLTNRQKHPAVLHSTPALP